MPVPHAGQADRAVEATAPYLVVEDDEAMREMLTEFLHTQGLPAVVASSRRELRKRLKGPEPALIFLDLNLGDDNGLDLLKEIRSQSDVPVIIMTGHRRGDLDRVLGLELGADDYLTKPFNLHELVARGRAVLRRQELGRSGRRREGERGGYRFSGWQLDRRTRRLTDPDGVPVGLTKGEYALLLAFLQSPQRPLMREQLLQATRVHEDIADRSIDVQVLRLRRKLRDDPAQPRVILTERGVGYVFAPSVDPY
ncbi:response regulator [Lutibaculum baratangense]|nr:response regulator [Lutibaculum baratangense]